MLVRREPHVADVDAAEQAVPVAVVGLAAVEVVDRPLLLGPAGHRGDLRGRAQHLLVQVVDLSVLDLEVAPEPAAQPARLRAVIRHGRVEEGVNTTVSPAGSAHSPISAYEDVGT